MKIYDIGKKIVQTFISQGYLSYFVGGWVRDFLLCIPSEDIDIVTEAPISVTQKLFLKTIPVGAKFGVLLVVEEGHTFEVAMLRADGDYRDGRRPDRISHASLKEDAFRRDFTVNGMYYDPLNEEIYDYVHGREDIERRIIRTIGDPQKRFSEDRLRMMRAVRYSVKLSFFIEERTFRAITHQAQELLSSVSIERVWQEFEKIDRFSSLAPSIVLLYKTKLLFSLFPSLQKKSLLEMAHLVYNIPFFPKNSPTISKLYELFPGISLHERLNLCQYFKLSRRERSFSRELHLWFSTEHFDLCDWAHLYALPNAEICEEIIVLHDPKQKFFHKRQKEKLMFFIDRIKNRNPLIAARDIINLGYCPGKKVGDLLKIAEKIAINENIVDKKEVILRLISFLKK